jgi:hypothetical protein
VVSRIGSVSASMGWACLAIVIAVVFFAGLGEAHRSSAQEGDATPVAVDFDQLVGERPAEIVAGNCDEPGEPVAILTALTTPEGEAQGQGAAIEAERSYTAIPLALADLLAGQSSVRVLLSTEASDIAVACGEVGGVPSEGGSIVVKLSERNDSGFTGIAFLAPDETGGVGVSVFLAGERSVAETRELAAATPSVALEAVAEPTPTAEPVQVVDVALLEWVVDAPSEIRAGQVNLVVTNEGSLPHGLVLESAGVVVAELPQPIGPDETSVLSVTLPEGNYVLFCPLEDGAHREEGMEAELTVVP